MTRESDIEKYLERRVREQGGATRKVKWIGRHSAPDRLVMLDGRHYLVELKRPGEKARAAQLREHKRLRDMGGFAVLVLDTFERIDLFILEANNQLLRA